MSKQNLRGVYPATKKDGTVYYRASITHQNKHISLGSYDTPGEAHAAYWEGAILLTKKDLVGMRQHAILIKDYERECDEVLRSSIKQLFLNEKDPIRLIKFKDIYEQLEEIADYCQTVANTIETIIMRNA